MRSYPIWGGVQNLSKETATLVQNAEKQYRDEVSKRESAKNKRTQVCSLCVRRTECWGKRNEYPDKYGCETQFKVDQSLIH